MSIAAPRPGREWLPLIVAMTVGASVGLGASVLNIATSGPPIRSGASSIAATNAQHAAWEFSFTRPRLQGRAERASSSAERSALRSSLEELYHALLLDRAALNDVLRTTFARSAADALRKAKTGWPAGVGGVEITKRSADIGIQVQGGRRAIAVVAWNGRGLLDERPLMLRHRSTMWLEKTDGRWRVIAFDITERTPMKKRPR